MAAPVVIAATAKHTATLIFLHGLGDTGHGWASAIASLRPPHVKVICPTAPTMPVSLNAGFRMPSWFDLMSLDATGPEDTNGIQTATSQIHAMVQEEIKSGIPANRIILGGFSQGGALALYSTLTFAEQLGGVVALSCWLPLRKSFPSAQKCSKVIPVLQCHGDCDPIVPYKWGQMTASFLKSLFSSPEFKTYSGLMHTSSDDELRDVKEFVNKHLPSQ